MERSAQGEGPVKTNTCRACRAEIVFLACKNGHMPVDAGSVKEGDTDFDHTKHVSHFATCSSPGQFRRRQHTANPASTPR